MTLRFTAGTTTTVTEFGVNGTSGAPVTLTSATSAQHFLVADGAPITCDYPAISYSHATGFSAGANSVDDGSNAGRFPLVFEGALAVDTDEVFAGMGVLEVAMELDDTDPDDPSWYLPSPGLTAVQTALLVGAAYVGCCVDDATGHVLLEWPVPVRALPL